MQNHSFFHNPSLRTAEIDHFAIHTFEYEDVSYTNAFAIVKWLLPHPSYNLFGKPYSVWCNSVYESNYDNCFLPLEYISSLLLTAKHTLVDDTVIVTVPALC